MTVLCSGGFDPLHVGHLRYLQCSARFGEVIVALNSDEWLIRKKGYRFMLWRHRAVILLALPCVSSIEATEGDTVCDVLRRVRPHYFANGGDRTVANPDEHAVCEELGIEELFNIGGQKIASSSELVRAVDNHTYPVQN